MDLALNNLQRLICHKTQQTKSNQTNLSSFFCTQFFDIKQHNAKIKKVKEIQAYINNDGNNQ